MVGVLLKAYVNPEGHAEGAGRHEVNEILGGQVVAANRACHEKDFPDC